MPQQHVGLPEPHHVERDAAVLQVVRDVALPFVGHVLQDRDLFHESQRYACLTTFV